MKPIASRSSSLIFFALAAVSAQANLLINGSFETGPHGQRPSIPGWTATVGLVETNTAAVYGVSGQDGTYVGELDADGNSTIEQTFSLGAATLLHGSFLYGQRARTEPESNSFDVFLNGNLIASFVPNSTTMMSYSFTAMGLAGTNTISFAATGTSDTNGGLIDNVSLVASVPGPLAALPFALGLLRRRRRA